MSDFLVVVGIVNFSHWPEEGSHKAYSAATIPEGWLRDIHHRKNDYVNRLEDIFSGNSSFSTSWYSTLDRAKRYAELQHEQLQQKSVSDTFPIISIQGNHFRYAGFVYVDENEALVNDNFYKIERYLQVTESEVSQS